MNPNTNRFEELVAIHGPEEAARIKREQDEALADLRNTFEQVQDAALCRVLVRPDGSPVPKNWSVFTIGEHVVIKDYTFKVAYVGETAILFEPVGPVVLGTETQEDPG